MEAEQPLIQAPPMLPAQRWQPQLAPIPITEPTDDPQLVAMRSRIAELEAKLAVDAALEPAPLIQAPPMMPAQRWHPESWQQQPEPMLIIPAEGPQLEGMRSRIADAAPEPDPSNKQSTISPSIAPVASLQVALASHAALLD